MRLKKRLGDLLVELGYITEDNVIEAIKIQKSTDKRLGEIFLEMGVINEDTLLEILGTQLNIKRIHLNDTEFDMKAVTSISESLAKKYELIPVGFNKGKLIVAMSDPLNIFAEEDVSISTGYQLDIKLASKKSINNSISKYYSKNYMNETAEKMKLDSIERNTEVLLEEDEASPVIKLINTIIENAVRNRASDIHLEPQKNKVIIRYRIDGKLKKQFESPKEPYNGMITRIKLLANLDITEKRVPQDGKIIRRVSDRDIDLRVSIIPSINGENIVIRILDKEAFKLDKKNLGLSLNDIEKLNSILSKPYGITLITGPTGSGKTSTLYSILNDINKEENNIITVEDPVEYSLDEVVQVNVNKKANLTFAKGLRAILRQDPDLIMVGEIRDEETAIMAIRAAITGHKVLSTVHTNDAVRTIARLEDMGIKPYLLASSLVGIVSQRLIRKLCPYCKKEYLANINEKGALGINLEDELRLFKSCGCTYCSNIGYKGRVGIFEIMEINTEIREAISSRGGIAAIEEAAKRNGMKDILESAKEKVLNGTTSLSELLNIALIKG
ncbi:MAG: GspE/PulE family protein [Clostridium sp.]